MNVVFFDVDGVLNCRDTYFDCPRTLSGTRLPFDQNMVARLAKIVTLTNSKLVLSATCRRNFKWEENKIVAIWEKESYLLELLNQYKLTIYDMTPIFRVANRQMEIIEWLNCHKEVKHFIVIDDEVSVLSKLLPYVIQTKYSEGLTDEHVSLALEALKTPIQKYYIKKR